MGEILILTAYTVSNLMMLFVVWWICDKHARFERKTDLRFYRTWLVMNGNWIMDVTHEDGGVRFRFDPKDEVADE